MMFVVVCVCCIEKIEMVLWWVKICFFIGMYCFVG